MMNFSRLCFSLSFCFLIFAPKSLWAVQFLGDPTYTYCSCYHLDLTDFVIDVAQHSSYPNCTAVMTHNQNYGPNQGSLRDCVNFDPTTWDGSGLAIRTFPEGTVLSTIPVQSYTIPAQYQPNPDDPMQ